MQISKLHLLIAGWMGLPVYCAADDARIAKRIEGPIVEVSPGRVALIANYGEVRCVDRDGSQVWSYQGVSGRGGFEQEQIIKLENGELIVIADGFAKLDKNGGEIWHLPSKRSMDDLAAISVDQRMLFTVEKMFTLNAYDLTTGANEWQANVGLDSTVPLSVSERQIVCVNVLGDIVAISMQGETLWKKDLPERVVAISGPNSTGMRVFGTGDGKLYSLGNDGKATVLPMDPVPGLRSIACLEEHQFLCLDAERLRMFKMDGSVDWTVQHGVKTDARLQVVTQNAYALIAEDEESAIIRKVAGKWIVERLGRGDVTTNVVLGSDGKTLYFGTGNGWFCVRELQP